MTEGRVIVLLVSGVLLWMLGGTYWRPFRVVLWPLVAGVSLLGTHFLLWKVGLMVLTMGGMNSLPYGEKSSWPKRIAVFASYPLAAGWLSPQSLLLSIPLSMGLLGLFFYLSRRFNQFQWKIWEAQAGLLQAMSIIIAT